MRSHREVIEFAGFDEGDAFSIHEHLSRQPELCADADLRVLIGTRLSREQAAEMLEYAAHKLRTGTTDLSLEDIRMVLSRIGGVHG